MLTIVFPRVALGKQKIPYGLYQTGKLGSFRQDLGGATAVKSKGRGEKSDPGAGSGAARGTKTNATMYM